MGKKGRKGKKRRASRKGAKRRGGRKAYKYGIAETLGIAKTALDVASNPSVGTAFKSTLAHPSLAGAKTSAVVVWDATKMSATPAITGIIISNADKLPIVGKMLAPAKHKLDSVSRKYLKMKV